LKAWRKYSGEESDDQNSEVAVVLAVKGMNETIQGGRIPPSDTKYICSSITISGKDLLERIAIKSVIKCTTDKKALAYLECLLKVLPTDRQLSRSIR